MTLITALFKLPLQVVYVGLSLLIADRIVFIFAGVAVNSIMIRLNAKELSSDPDFKISPGSGTRNGNVAMQFPRELRRLWLRAFQPTWTGQGSGISSLRGESGMTRKKKQETQKSGLTTSSRQTAKPKTTSS